MLNRPYEEKSLGTLLMDFFRHYGHDFSYATHYVSVSGKNIFTKKSKSWDLNPGSPAVLAVQCILNSGERVHESIHTKILSQYSSRREQYHKRMQQDCLDRRCFQGGVARVAEYSHRCLNRGAKLRPEWYIFGTRRGEISVLSPKDRTEGTSCFKDIVRREALEASVASGAFARAAEACSSLTPSTNLGSSGGVFLGPRNSQARQNQRNGHSRPGAGLASRAPTGMPRNGSSGGPRGSNAWGAPNGPVNTQQPEVLPVLRWQNDRNRFRQQQPATQARSNNPQFDFTFRNQPQHYQNMATQFFSATAGPILNAHNPHNRSFGHQQHIVSNNYPLPQRPRGGR